MLRTGSEWCVWLRQSPKSMPQKRRFYAGKCLNPNWFDQSELIEFISAIFCWLIKSKKINCFFFFFDSKTVWNLASAILRWSRPLSLRKQTVSMFQSPVCKLKNDRLNFTAQSEVWSGFFFSRGNYYGSIMDRKIDLLVLLWWFKVESYYIEEEHNCVHDRSRSAPGSTDDAGAGVCLPKWLCNSE